MNLVKGEKIKEERRKEKLKNKRRKFFKKNSKGIKNKKKRTNFNE